MHVAKQLKVGEAKFIKLAVHQLETAGHRLPEHGAQAYRLPLCEIDARKTKTRRLTAYEFKDKKCFLW